MVEILSFDIVRLETGSSIDSNTSLLMLIVDTEPLNQLRQRTIDYSDNAEIIATCLPDCLKYYVIPQGLSVHSIIDHFERSKTKELGFTKSVRSGCNSWLAKLRGSQRCVFKISR